MDINYFLRSVMYDVNCSSMLFSDKYTKIFFDGGFVDVAGRLLIEGDCNIFVFDSEVEFYSEFQIDKCTREEYLINIYNLTGYDICDAKVVFDNVLMIFVDGLYVYFVPSKFEGKPWSFWLVNIEMLNYEIKLVAKCTGGTVFSNFEDDLFHGLLE